jgi:Spy/CpxP family protein refolding chaperone
MTNSGWSKKRSKKKSGPRRSTMKEKRALVVLAMTLFLGGLILSAQTPDQKPSERQRVRENIHRLRLLRMTEALDLSEEQAAKMYPAASLLEKEKAGILKVIDGEMGVLRELLEEKSPDEVRLSAGVAKIKELRQSLQAKDREFEDFLEQNLSPVQRAKYVLFSAEFYRRVAAGLKRAREQTRARRRS